jgi:putative SOS response-associated peptidase YedK
MCGRLVLTSSYKEKIRAFFDELDADTWLPPRYNITPGQRIPRLSANASGLRLDWPLWGFPPPQPGRPPLINARSETVHKRPSFREAFTSHRCLVMADGFYEWQRDHSRPQPWFFHPRGDHALALAALTRPGQPDDTCVIITTEANSLMHPIHDRMPVLFTPAAARLWLNPDTHPDTLLTLLQPAPPDALACHPVSDRVNRNTSEGPDLIQPVTIYEQPGLF